jgi:predicted nuclease of restriction endonuclease-like (RecB) superfamily
MEQHIDTNSIKEAVGVIKTAILQGQYLAAKDVTRVQLATYFSIGKYLSLKTRIATWGSGALESISKQLRKELPGLRGFSATNLRNMRLFYENWNMLDGNSSVATDELNRAINSGDANQPQSNSSVITDELQQIVNHVDIAHSMAVPNVGAFPVEDFFKTPFTHQIEIFTRVSELDKRYYYIHRCAEEHLSVDKLKSLIKEDAYSHQATMPNNFLATMTDANLARRAVRMFKDDYLLDFINIEEIGERDIEDVDERVIEQQIVQNVKKFIMTFGQDFTFMGNQYFLETHGIEYFPDLLFFNRELNSIVCVELKTGVFKPSYLGQLMTYLRIIDDKVRKPHENPSIGIVLCKSADKDFVEYVIQDYNKPMGVATYTTSEEMPERLRKALPDIDELKKLL